ncbi:M20 metallopeptidase family protein [Streptomyces lateritius]|uniref:M20 metallopeptidase family protein n=1 Tax=Streptomyces lateritius TaxID=67313 RepID=UPI0016796950|nr:amidohydrolase [Streptomyces lateritius]GGT74563.1 N-acyl-L-amino acid amidohydrolase [Streptomyces lateritius]
MSSAGVDDGGAGVHEELDRRAEEVAARVVAWRRHLHRNPELPNREAETARFVADHLRSLGLDEVRTGIAGHGVVGVLRGGSPGGRVAALRADMDALPVQDLCGEEFASDVVDAACPGGPSPVSHACGHDCHTAMLMGAATVLAGVRERLPGTVLFVFQPAEEGPPVTEQGGARAMVEAGAFTDPVPTMVFGMHVTPYPKGYVGLRVGNQYGASTLVKIVITGEQTHGSTPWQGIDPMPAAGAVLTGIGQLYRQVSAFDAITVSVGHVEDVGRFNIIGRTVTLWGTVRCAVESDMPEVRRRLTTLAEHSAQAYGATASVAYLQPVPPVHNSAEWVEAGLPTIRRVVGEERMVETGATLGYDDVSEFVNRFGGLYVMLGVQDASLDADGRPVPLPHGRGLVTNHNPRFYADDDTLLTGVRLHAHMAYDHLTGAAPACGGWARGACAGPRGRRRPG